MAAKQYGKEMALTVTFSFTLYRQSAGVSLLFVVGYDAISNLNC